MADDVVPEELAGLVEIETSEAAAQAESRDTASNDPTDATAALRTDRLTNAPRGTGMKSISRENAPRPPNVPEPTCEPPPPDFLRGRAFRPDPFFSARADRPAQR